MAVRNGQGGSRASGTLATSATIHDLRDTFRERLPIESLLRATPAFPRTTCLRAETRKKKSSVLTCPVDQLQSYQTNAQHNTRAASQDWPVYTWHPWIKPDRWFLFTEYREHLRYVHGSSTRLARLDYTRFGIVRPGEERAR